MNEYESTTAPQIKSGIRLKALKMQTLNYITDNDNDGLERVLVQQKSLVSC